MEQSPLVHRSWTLHSGSSNPLLARHCSYSWFTSNPTTSVNVLAMLLFPAAWICHHNAVYVCWRIYRNYVDWVHCIRVWTQYTARKVQEHLWCFINIFSFVLIVATISITIKLQSLWIIPILFSVFGLAIMYLSIAFRKQGYLRIIQPLVCFVLSLIYCMAYMDNAHPMKF